jgi:hypothetical protein
VEKLFKQNSEKGIEKKNVYYHQPVQEKAENW